MARLPGIIIPGQPQHIIVRGNNRSEIFCCDADYHFYLERLQVACKKHDCQIRANQRNNCIFDTRIFSHLLERHRKHGALRVYCFLCGYSDQGWIGETRTISHRLKERSGIY